MAPRSNVSSPRNGRLPPSSPAQAPAPRDKAATKQKMTLQDLVNRLHPTVKEILFTQRYFWHVAAAVLVADSILTLAIIRFVAYTEIDFSTYMQQAQQFLADGQRNYSQIKGDTGPCVYPAGHLFFYSIIHRLTDGGKNLRVGQYLFGGLYMISQALMVAIYQKAGAPAILLPILASSKRLHSIYALRMFNDGVAMTIMFSAILLLANHKYRMGTVVTSLALSVKMNILLFVPALAVILFRARGFWPGLVDGLTLVLVQVLVSLPFSLTHPFEYFSQAFDLSRVFLYKWTVNLRFLPEEVFLDVRLSMALLLVHAGLLIAFGWYKWTAISRIGASSWFRAQWRAKEVLSPKFIVLSLLTSNLIGIICARSLHYQFYAWYAQSLPLLLWNVNLQGTTKAILPIAIEVAWNTYPSTNTSSLLLCASNLLLLLGLFKMDHAGLEASSSTSNGIRSKSSSASGTQKKD
ncbi:ALG3-domain-containing protein [Microstroma glucosiphilum]|uniref:Dol-P-Man:Man(5)GlcNAc(2)-PP-Dol alpha-1,3-mannosyltransferase n=1 Tax=Pseudomicrostroma glucosiphilum TaxID=1684307 RepID=A0A316U0C9_9BASI|nr:ALG3-domain-containing protein [Pseudomicrostroma glucosiphilum]PWN17981.1 ALG3-domain-containing protein [Pseudomicrostroma glucosiphilum]